MNEVYAIFTVNRDIINFTSDLMEICSSKEDAMEGIVEIASNFEDSLRDNYYSDAYDEPTLAVKKVELDSLYSLAWEINYDVRFNCTQLLNIATKGEAPKWDDYLVKKPSLDRASFIHSQLR